MAQVYKAHQATIDRIVAVKVLHPHLAESADFIERFKREARGLGQLNHPHIVSVFDFDVEDEYYYMAMDHIPGPTLGDVLRENERLSLESALRVTEQLAGALAYAHENGAIHRDLKPVNIIFKDDTLAHAMLTDFGIARILDEATMTMSGSVAGTPSYMSPEAVRGERVDGRADIYSLGIVLYEMIAGHLPYSGDTTWSVMMQQVNEPPPRLEELDPDIPLCVSDLIEKAMAKSIETRFQTAGEFQEAVREVQAALESGAVVTAREAGRQEKKPTPPPPDKPAKASFPASQPWSAYIKTRRGWAVAGALLLLLFTVVGFAWRSAAAGIPFSALLPGWQTPVVEEDRFGFVRFSHSQEGQSLTLWLDRAAKPPAGYEYHWWVYTTDQRVLRLGALEYDNGRIYHAAHLDEEMPANFAAIQITLEIAGQPPETPSNQVVFAGEMDESYAAEMAALFVASDERTGKGYFPAAAEQLALATQHYQFLQRSLAENDLPEARRHTEHVINILDGEEGEFFGDLDGDGQAQNPGDGVGLRRYVAGANARLDAAANLLPPTQLRQYRVAAAQAANDQVLRLLDEAIREGLRVIASDTVGEAQIPADHMGVYINELLAGSLVELQPLADDAEEHLHDHTGVYTADIADLIALAATRSLVSDAAAHALSLSDVALLPDEFHPPLPPPEPPFIPDDRLGFFYAQPDGQFLLQLDQITPAADNARYALWAERDQDGRAVRLASFDAAAALVWLPAQTEINLLEEYDRLLITLETGDNAAPFGPLYAAGDFDRELTRLIVDLTSSASLQEKGELYGAVEQTELALLHADFMRQALQDSDLVEARRHAEHIVNILDGEEGDYFGDVDGDGQIQNPGDGVGARVYLLRLVERLQDAGELMALSVNQRFFLDQAIRSAQNGQTLLDATVAEALRVIAADTVEEAMPISENVQRRLTEMLEGVDENGSGAIDPLLGEGGLAVVNGFLFSLTETAVYKTPAGE